MWRSSCPKSTCASASTCVPSRARRRREHAPQAAVAESRAVGCAVPRPAQLKQSDGDEERKGVYVSDEEEHELSGGSKARPAMTPPRCRRRCIAPATPGGADARPAPRAVQDIAHFVFSWPDVKRQARPARGVRR